MIDNFGELWLCKIGGFDDQKINLYVYEIGLTRFVLFSDRIFIDNFPLAFNPLYIEPIKYQKDIHILYFLFAIFCGY